MAIFHLHLKILTRSKGASAVGKAAYISGDKLHSEYDGRYFDYDRKSRVVHKEIVLPEHAPREYADRSVLWNAGEKAETAKNAQLAREVELSLPVELTQEQSITFLRQYVITQFQSKGMAADVAVHDSGDGNPHAHILLTMRPLNEGGSRTFAADATPTAIVAHLILGKSLNFFVFTS
jgi:ATP-dependent exoDNAse (exonuclease V) alpha subunit